MSLRSRASASAAKPGMRSGASGGTSASSATQSRSNASRTLWTQARWPGGDTLECAYHGWRFDGSGRCVAVPAVPDFVPPPGHRAWSHSVRIAFGLVWVALDADVPPDAPDRMPGFAAEADERLRKLNCGPYDVATSAPRIVENFLDMSHFGFVHEGVLGERAFTAMAAHGIERTERGFRAVGCRAWQPQASLQASGGTMVDYTYEVDAPYACVLTKLPDPADVAVADFHESIALFCARWRPSAAGYGSGWR